jgi:putative ABC transport system permease protein
LTLTVSDPSKTDSVVSEVRKEVPDVGVYKSQEATGRLTPLISSITLGSLTLFAIAGVACFLGITNVVMTGLFERTREIGILKAIGAQGTDVMKLILFESAALGTLGGLLGCLVSLILLSQGLPILITPTTSFEIPIVFEVFVQGLAISVAISVLATIYPVWRAVRVRPHEVLRFG